MTTTAATMRVTMRVVLVCVLATAAATASATVGTGRLPPVLPTQFSADVSIVSHLTDPRQSYPPSVRTMRIQYDYEQQVARAEMLRGHDANKTFVRRYDQKREYMVKHGQYQKCERAYLGASHAVVLALRVISSLIFRPLHHLLCLVTCVSGEDMPAPTIPFLQQFVVRPRASWRRTSTSADTQER